ncbi:MAG TPA: biotin--[acetyl-CoA-carboxylase] ligase [Gaiellaceae bacterium]|nr:biotin--[acetyl-CoA-carboxylase] ligase [Gaiellaceae bacterium]
MTLVRRVVRLDATGSTNDDARRLAQEGAPEGTVVIARSQSAGRGRLGRSWHSPYGSGLYLSIVLRPQEPLEQVGRYALVAALAALEACHASGATGARVKWPNDILVDGRKVAGILAELRAGGGGAELVLGFGLNVGTPPEGYPAELAAVTSLSAAAGRTVDVDETAPALLESLDRWIGHLRRGGWEEVREAFVRYAPGVEGARVTLRGGVAGITRGLDATGALLVETAQGDVPVHAGESLASWEA